jgi:hypothetical protein
MSLFADSDPSAEPVGKPCLVDIVRGHSEDGRLSFVDVKGVGIPDDIVEIEEEYEARPARPLVAVGQRVIPRQMTCQHRRLVDEIRVEVLIAEAGLRGVKG